MGFVFSDFFGIALCWSFDPTFKSQKGLIQLIFFCYRYIEPLPPGSSPKFEFDNMIVGQNIPSGFIPAIEKGFKEATNS